MTDPLATFLDARAVDALVARAAASPRRRQNLNLHAELSDPIQRFLNAGEPGTYVRPHRHQAGRWELFTALRGSMDLLLFSDDGAITMRAALDAQSGSVVEIPGGVWHCFVIRAPGTVGLEIKPGPYVAQTDKEFVDWAPAEGEPAAERIVTWLATAQIGQRWIGS
jgi:cupin fold WbuC family metalloprotein